MKATFEKVEKKLGSSFSVISYSNPYFAAPLHIHPEYELILIEEGTGLSFVGDSIRKLQPGDFMLIGSNLPHLWLSGDEYYNEGNCLVSRSIYTQFNKNIFPENIYDIPELSDIYTILKKSEKGLFFESDNIEEMKNMFRNLVNTEGFKKINDFYMLLYRLSTECIYHELTTDIYHNENNSEKDLIISKVHAFINNNYQNDISLGDIAGNVGMNPSALCRYYKKHTGKKMFEYLTELRISYAVKLLSNRSINIGQIAYDCGYNSLSHFNHQFKDITGYTPSDYSKYVLKKQ